MIQNAVRISYMNFPVTSMLTDDANLKDQKRKNYFITNARIVSKVLLLSENTKILFSCSLIVIGIETLYKIQQKLCRETGMSVKLNTWLGRFVTATRS